ncbi:hypothetical protein Pyn_13029 [Prunus yedoensis var. nudiflora]|uniref:Uncharacterized protein n=1 Tax=Prunus yedoensis var. nudiflora TaxID=2094558 RepID=A0A314UED8_PRUYE|nr:hypothetical protein Pyn_13029 [Prunus yedoensis var. nudiflora]
MSVARLAYVRRRVDEMPVWPTSGDVSRVWPVWPTSGDVSMRVARLAYVRRRVDESGPVWPTSGDVSISEWPVWPETCR